MSRVEHIGDATLYLGDARDVLPTLQRADAVVCDPPYGIGEARPRNVSRTRPRGGNAVGMKGKTIVCRDYGDDDWDDAPLDADLLALVRAAGRWNIIFGGNYYALPPSTCWLVWDKLNGDSAYSDCELAWTNLPGAVRRLCYLWNGICKAPGELRGDHPTQKPIGVMRWCLQRLPAGTRTIIDPVMGSGTTGVASVAEGMAFTGIERETKYFDAACRRIEQAYKQPRLFPEPAPKLTTPSMFE